MSLAHCLAGREPVSCTGREWVRVRVSCGCVKLTYGDPCHDRWLVWTEQVCAVTCRVVPVAVLCVAPQWTCKWVRVKLCDPVTCKVYFRDECSQTVLRAAKLRQKLQINLAALPSHNVLTPGQPD